MNTYEELEEAFKRADNYLDCPVALVIIKYGRHLVRLGEFSLGQYPRVIIENQLQVVKRYKAIMDLRNDEALKFCESLHYKGDREMVCISIATIFDGIRKNINGNNSEGDDADN